MKRRAVVEVLAALGVIFAVTQEVTMPCADKPARVLIRQDNGTYKQMVAYGERTCKRRRVWLEEWTAYPEKGGIFLGIITRDLAP